jgi:hypothetical protein
MYASVSAGGLVHTSAEQAQSTRYGEPPPPELSVTFMASRNQRLIKSVATANPPWSSTRGYMRHAARPTLPATHCRCRVHPCTGLTLRLEFRTRRLSSRAKGPRVVESCRIKIVACQMPNSSQDASVSHPPTRPPDHGRTGLADTCPSCSNRKESWPQLLTAHETVRQ